MSDAVRSDSNAQPATPCAERVLAIFRSRGWSARLVAALYLPVLISGTLYAQPRRRASSMMWMQARGQRGPNRFGNPQMGGTQARRQQHLPQWFRQHQNLSPQAQERALRNEPGFDRLPPREQQRLFNRLQQLNAMPPERRERTLQRMEALERLSPEQRQQVRSAMQQVTQMPADRQRMMHKAFRDLSQLPPEQRQAVLNSSQFKNQFSDNERQTLGTLMSVQPYSPPAVNSGVEYGGKQ